MNPKKIIIAGGGTGGHVYPGVSIARALQKISPDVAVEFVGSVDGLENKILPREGFRLHLINGGKLNLQGQFLQKMKTLAKIPCGMWQSFVLLLKEKPDFVLGVGGYSSGPFVLAASLLGVPCGIWEANARPGLANRWLSRFVNVCYVVFAESKKELNSAQIFEFGMPVREEIEKGAKTQRRTKSSVEPFSILSFGGSQGARAISTALIQAVTESQKLKNAKWIQNVKLVHQIGALDFARVKGQYDNFLDFVTPLEFIYDMPKYYEQADLVIVRGGAGTLVEVSAFGVVPIVIPLPAADDHQLHNAQVLAQNDAGILLLQKNLTAQALVDCIESLRQNPEKLKSMSENLRKLFKPNSADRIAEDILKRLKK